MGNCGTCNQSRCACPSVIPAPCSVEQHVRDVIFESYAYGLEVKTKWNIPAIGATAVLYVPDAVAIPVGAYIWNKIYGYFSIIAFDDEKKFLSISNPNLEGNQDPGTQIPGCTVFTVSPPPCCADLDQSGVYLKGDFVAPAEGSCADIAVTVTTGLSGGNGLQIGTASYRISSIDENSGVVTICNDGEGFTAGTLIRSQDAAGAYQYPIIPFNISPCEKARVLTGTVIACVNGQESALTGDTYGGLLTVTNVATGEAVYSTLVPAAVGGLLADVSTIQTNITNIQNALVPCALAASLDGTAYHVGSGGTTSGNTTSPSTLDGTDPSVKSVGETATVYISNPSPCRNMQISITFMFDFTCVVGGVMGGFGEVTYRATNYYVVGTIASPPTPITPSNILFDYARVATCGNPGSPPSGGSPCSDSTSKTFTFILAPLQQIVYTARSEVFYYDITGNTTLYLTSLPTSISYFSIAL